MDEILIEGLRLYQNWQERDESLLELSYKKPSNYVDIPSLTNNMLDRARSKTINKDNPNDDWQLEIALYLDSILLDTSSETKCTTLIK